MRRRNALKLLARHRPAAAAARSHLNAEEFAWLFEVVADEQTEEPPPDHPGNLEADLDVVRPCGVPSGVVQQRWATLEQVWAGARRGGLLEVVGVSPVTGFATVWV